MSVQTQIDRISGNITAALAAVAEKGVTVPDGSNSDALAELIARIEAGGGVGSKLEFSTLIPSENVSISSPLTVSHSLGKLPNIVCVFTCDSIEKSSFGVRISIYYVPEFIVGNSNKFYSCGAYYSTSWQVKSASSESNSGSLGLLLSSAPAPISDATENDITLCGIRNNTIANLVAGNTYFLLIGVIE